uniref:Uncharacterized protein n=1 Tax=Phytophthora ramorum TaxID=164328 RepID=H3H866_PHYRM
MVLTRAQAKAEAEAQAARGDEDDHVEDIYDRPSADAEYPDDETENMTEGPSRDTASALVVAEKPGANIFPGIEEHLEKLAGFFLAQTRYLVEGHAMLQSQQEGQSNVQSAALMAIQGSTETCIKQLMDQQLAIAGQFQEELMATQSAICEQLMAMQAQAGEQIKTSVTEKLFNALREMQSNRVNLLETQLAAKMDDIFQILTSRIQQLVEEQTATDIQLQVQRQADATSILRDQFQQHCDRAQLKQGSVGEGLRSDDAKELVRKEVDECMTTLQRQFHAVELQAVERERQAELQANETELRQLQAVEHAREAELQAKEAEVNHGVTEVIGERLRDPAADILAEIKQSLERSVKTIIELISVAVDGYAQTKEEIKTEIENRGSGSSCKHITDAFTPPSLGLKSQAHHRYLHSLCMWKDHCFKMASVLGTNTITMDFHQQCKVVLRHLTVFVAVAEVVVAVGETADVLKTAGEPHRGNDTESAEVASWNGGRRQTVV